MAGFNNFQTTQIKKIFNPTPESGTENEELNRLFYHVALYSTNEYHSV